MNNLCFEQGEELFENAPKFIDSQDSYKRIRLIYYNNSYVQKNDNNNFLSLYRYILNSMLDEVQGE